MPEDAVYPFAEIDGDGKPLNGANRYSLHFTKAEIPPVDAFWSLTMYDDDTYLVANPINRYALGDRSDLALDAEGGLTLYVRSDSPGKDKESNWLPAPKDAGFKLALGSMRQRRKSRTGRGRRHRRSARADAGYWLTVIQRKSEMPHSPSDAVSADTIREERAY